MAISSAGASSRVPFVYQDIKGQAPGKDLVKARFGKDPILWGCAAQDGWQTPPELVRDAERHRGEKSSRPQKK